MEAVIPAITVLLLTGCQVGPKYTVPAVPAPPAFKESAPAAYSSALPGTWQPANPQDALIKGKWWEMFNEPELNTLEEQLDINNQNIAQAFQSFMAARAQVGEAHAGYFPAVTANPSVAKAASPFANGNSNSNSSTTTTVTSNTSGGGIAGFALPFEATWAPDLWGRIRNTVRGAQYAAQVSAADLENERLTEQAALAEFYFQLRGQDSLQNVYTRFIETDRQLLELTRALVETGIDSPG